LIGKISFGWSLIWRLAAQQITHTLTRLQREIWRRRSGYRSRYDLDTFQVNIEGKLDIIARHPAIAIAREVISAIQIAHDLERPAILPKISANASSSSIVKIYRST
jgi:hypothetical protein